MTRHLSLFVRFVVTATLLVWLFRDRTLHVQLAALPMPRHAVWLVAAWLAAGLGEIAGLLRFWCCLQLAGIPLPLRRAAALHFAGLFTSLFLPGMAGGDALKIALLAVYFPQRRWASLLAVLLDRLSGFVVITVWTALIAWTRGDWFAQNTIAASALRTVLFIAGPLAASLIAWYLLSRTHLMRTRLVRFPFRERILRCEAGFDALAADRPRSLVVLLTSIAGFVAYFTIFHCTAQAYGAPLIWRDTLAVMPLLDLIIMLPVTIAGIGLREQAFRAILAPLCGLTSTQGVMVSLTGFLVASTWSLLGAPVFLWLRPTLRPTTAHA